MGGKAGRRTLRWAQGPGRQSGLWAFAAAAVAALPFLDAVRPVCRGATASLCQQGWERFFFLPNLFFIPAVLLICVAIGSWIAQRLHARHDKRFYAALDDRDPEIPPGHHRPPDLERDLIRRTMQWVAFGALVAAGSFAYFAMTPIGRRACDPWSLKASSLQVCQGAAQWSDALIAYETWLFLVAAVLWAGLLLVRARRFRAPRTTRRPMDARSTGRSV